MLFCWAFNFVLFLCQHTRFSFFSRKKGLANLSHSHLIHRLFCDFDNGSLDTIHIYSQINLSSNRKCVCACVWAYVKEPYLERERVIQSMFFVHTKRYIKISKPFDNITNINHMHQRTRNKLSFAPLNSPYILKTMEIYNKF